MMPTQSTEDYFHYAVHQIRLGRRHHMPGVRTCSDCGEHYPSDNTTMSWCPDCRINHDRICIHCGTHFDGTPGGNRLCRSCRHQQTLF